MTPEVKKLIVDALLSGEYQQGTRYMKYIDYNQDNKLCFCILGVISDLYLKLNNKVWDYFENGTYGYSTNKYNNQFWCVLSHEVRMWAGFDYSLGGLSKSVEYNSNEYSTLSSLNDSGMTFAEFVDVINNHM